MRAEGFYFKKKENHLFISSHQTLFKGHLRRRTWTHEYSETLDCKWVFQLDGRTEPVLALLLHQPWPECRCHGAGRDCCVLMDTGQGFQAVGVRVSSCALQLGLCFCCSAHSRLTWMPAACGGRKGSCAKKAVYYAFVCSIYCFVKTWRTKLVSPFLFFWRLVGLSSAVGVNK